MKDDNYVTVFHGTSKHAAELIVKEGLKPGAGSGADKWASLRHMGVAKVKRRKSVYVSKSHFQSSVFASYAAEVNKDEPVLLELKVPKQDFEKTFKRDEWSFGPDYRAESDIPPAWIVAERKPDAHSEHRTQGNTLLEALMISLENGELE